MRRGRIKTVYKRITAKENLPKSIALGTVGFLAAGAIAKAVPMSGKPYIVPLAATVIAAMFGKRFLGKFTVPVTMGLGMAALTTFIASNENLKGLLSDFCQPCGLSDFDSRRIQNIR